MNTIKPRLIATPLTRKLQIAVALSSVIFTIGTTLQNFVIVNPSFIETMMRIAGAADPVGEAPGFTLWFRGVGCIYILGNALGILALGSQSRMLWWIVFAVNITQSLGFMMIPSSMWSVAIDMYGVWGILPSAVTDGGAIILALAMIFFMVKYRAPWALSRWQP